MELNTIKSTFQMQTCKITDIGEDNYRIKTFELSVNVKAKPGQFIMVWVPYFGERPMSIGSASPLSVTAANVGKVSSEMHKLKKGDILSFRGPIGNAFSLKKNAAKILLVGGGYGVVPLAFLAREAKKQNIESIVVIGAKTRDDVIYKNKFTGSTIIVTTDDGTEGMHGNAIDGVKKLLGEKQNFDAIYSCGPEKMMYALAQLCEEKGIYCELSIERYIKCGINICGACAIDGKMCCRDGPVFNAKEVLGFSEFGKSLRDASGKKCELVRV